MRRMAVPDSDSSSPAVVSKLKGKQRAIEQNEGEEDGDLSIVSTGPSAKPLNRLRRGGGAGSKQLVVSDDEEESVPSKEKKPEKRKKKKKPILTHKGAAKFGIFDTEAINSSEPEEASSESYDSENSIDRDFVAGDDEEIEQGHTFYRDSLNTQYGGGAGGAGGGPVFENEPEWLKKRKRWADPEHWATRNGKKGPLPDTPRSQEQEPSQWR
jgi:hypothetical protein